MGERERMEITEGQSWALSSPSGAPSSTAEEQEAQGLAQGHMPLIQPLLGRGSVEEGSGRSLSAVATGEIRASPTARRGEWKIFIFFS